MRGHVDARRSSWICHITSQIIAQQQSPSDWSKKRANKPNKSIWLLRELNLFGADSVRWQRSKLTLARYSLPASKLPSAVIQISNCRVVPRANVSRRLLLSSSSPMLQGSLLNGLHRQARTYLSRAYKLWFLFVRLVRSHREGYDLTRQAYACISGFRCPVPNTSLSIS